jgi:hypothetical protein
VLDVARVALDRAHQLPVADHGEPDAAEARVAGHERVGVARPVRGRALAHRRRQRRMRCRIARGRGGLADRRRLEEVAQLVDVLDVVRAHAARHVAAAFDGDQPFAREARERLADRGARHAELGRERHLAQALARAQAPLAQELAQGVVDAVAQRERAVERRELRGQARSPGLHTVYSVPRDRVKTKRSLPAGCATPPAARRP